MPAKTAPILVYLSSTLSDLKDERDAVLDVLRRSSCAVKESYEPSNAGLVQKCLDDVGMCELYIGIIGLRYGFIPPGQSLSITQLEYNQAKARGIPRFIFIKEEASVPSTQTDASTDENPKEKILGFRALLSSGAAGEPTPARFGNLADLKLAVLKTIADARYKRTGGATLMNGEAPHPWAVAYEVCIGCVPGTDDSLKRTFQGLAQADQRIATFDLSPTQPKDYFARLDAQARKSRSLMLMITAASLSRLAAVSGDVATSVAIVRERTAGIFGLLVDVQPDALPADLRAALTDVFVTTAGDWAGAAGTDTFDKLQQWRRARAPEPPAETRVAVPYMVVAPKASEAEAMHADPARFFATFGLGADIRRAEFDGLSQRLTQISSEWPKGFYGPSRKDWRPFGPGLPTMNDFVVSAARRVNQSERGTRERRLLRNTQLGLLPYSFDEYLTDQAGSQDNLRRVCDLGCLVLLDEFALLHPTLRHQVDSLLRSNNAAVVSISACDPTLRPLGEMLGEFSHLRVGNLMSRFSHLEDLRCELALNSAERLQRWLRLVLPELLTTLGHDQVDPALAGNVEQLFERAG